MTLELDDDTARLLRALEASPEGERADPDHVARRVGERFARAAWARLAEPGDATAGRLIEALGAVAALDAVIQGSLPVAGEAGLLDPAAFAKGIARWQPRLDKQATLQDLRRALETGTRLIMQGDRCWPGSFADLGPHAPLMLWLRGDPALLQRTSLAVVGARACTGYGAHVTAEITDGVCAADVVIVSGAAYGIDAVAHRTALAAGGKTIAVLAGGVDRPYPSGHAELLASIGREGLICSEMVPGSAPTRWRFLQRNRSIAALARATLVTEAGGRSGSLNTAGHAAELSRPLGAVPGPVTSPASSGCHRLIRDYDATLVTNAVEAQELMGIGVDVALFDLEPETDRPPPLHRRVLDALPLRGARGLNEIVREAGVTREEARGALAELQLLGHVTSAEPGVQVGAEPGWKLSRQC
ncbi:DNA-processing protein DprA [Leucobacter salsicius]|uniref:DNA-processing protein DprA n=1 Tax=Leucobacter salsicius TaxID=664638 RepID=UPI00034AFE5B|nr:DNA-processing protein DprA [Leucobacter salsicius]